MRVKSGILAVISLVLAACSGPGADDGTTVLRLWKHQAGPSEEAASYAAIERFNNSQDQWRIEAQSLPQNAYTESMMAASMAGNLPCLMTVDQPMVPSFVWAGHLRPLQGFIHPKSLEGVTPIAIGRYEGEAYSVGQFDAALAVYARKSALDAIGARIPTVDAPWSRSEFDRLLRDLKAEGNYAYPLDLQTRDVKADWWTYAFSPMLQSFGGDLIDRDTLTNAEGILNGSTAIDFATWFQDLFDKGYVNRSEPDERAFQKGRVALAYTGNWWALDYSNAVGDDLLILPPPDFGAGPIIGGGSWQWAISSTCQHPNAAAEFIDFLMTSEEVAAIADAAGMIPVTEEAAALTEKFNPNGEWRVFYEMMNRFARPRPATPAFAAISNAWLRAMRDVMNGKDVRDALDDAVDDIESVIEDNGGFSRPTSQENDR